jgi:hypothetical protein
MGVNLIPNFVQTDYLDGTSGSVTPFRVGFVNYNGVMIQGVSQPAPPKSVTGSGLKNQVKPPNQISFIGITGADRLVDSPVNDLGSWHPQIGGVSVSDKLEVEVTCESGSKWDSPNARGKTPVDTFLTRELADVRIELKARAHPDPADNEEFAILSAYLEKFILAKNTGALIQIYHQSTQAHGVDKITVRSVVGPHYNRSERKFVATIVCKEWTHAPKISTEKTPEKSISAGIQLDKQFGVIDDYKKPAPPSNDQYIKGLTKGWGVPG